MNMFQYSINYVFASYRLSKMNKTVKFNNKISNINYITKNNTIKM